MYVYNTTKPKLMCNLYKYAAQPWNQKASDIVEGG
jgi:hypothetical protein